MLRVLFFFFCATEAVLRRSANRIISFKQDRDVICTYTEMVYEDSNVPFHVFFVSPNYCPQIKTNYLVVVANMHLSGATNVSMEVKQSMMKLTLISE